MCAMIGQATAERVIRGLRLWEGLIAGGGRTGGSPARGALHSYATKPRQHAGGQGRANQCDQARQAEYQGHK